MHSPHNFHHRLATIADMAFFVLNYFDLFYVDIIHTSTYIHFAFLVHTSPPELYARV